MSYSSGRWTEGTPDDGAAQAEKVAYFAARLGVAGGRLLDVGCGWAAQLRPMVERHGVAEGVGLTMSDAQAAWVERAPRATDRGAVGELGRSRPGAAVRRDHVLRRLRALRPGRYDGRRSGPRLPSLLRPVLRLAAGGWLPRAGDHRPRRRTRHERAARAGPARRLRARPVPGVALTPPVRDRARLRAVLPRPRAAGRRAGLRPHHPQPGWRRWSPIGPRRRPRSGQRPTGASRPTSPRPRSSSACAPITNYRLVLERRPSVRR